MEDDNRYWEILLTVTSDFVLIVNSDYSIKKINPAAENFFAVSNKSATDINIFEFFARKNIAMPFGGDYDHKPIDITISYTSWIAPMEYHKLHWYVSTIENKTHDEKTILMVAKLVSNEEIHFFSKHFNQLVDCVPGSVYWKDADGRYLGCNKFMVETAGVASVDDIVGKTDFDLWPEQAQRIYDNDKMVMKKNELLLAEEEINISSEDKMYFSSIKIPLKNGDDIIGVIGSSMDITRLKKTEIKLTESNEALKAANDIKAEFIKNMSHDVRTPFMGILGIAEHLLDEENDPVKIKELGYIIESGKKLLAFFNSILSVMQKDHVLTYTKFEKFQVRKLLNDTKKIIEPVAYINGLKILIDVEAKVPQIILGDSAKIQQILLNLIGNAIKFTEKGHVKVYVGIIEESNDNILLEFIIEDTGVGIPKDKYEFIFEKFNRLSSVYKGKIKGLGLGLHIVKQLVEELQGEISVESRINYGSKFKCILPFRHQK